MIDTLCTSLQNDSFEKSWVYYLTAFILFGQIALKETLELDKILSGNFKK